MTGKNGYYFRLPLSKRYGRSAVQYLLFNNQSIVRHEKPSYSRNSALIVAILCGQKFPSSVPINLHSAGEKNVPEARRKSKDGLVVNLSRSIPKGIKI
ncbi:MAG: hypothetical protein M1481_04015 [Candidatus Thermoplasmatota archaeon]|nr:hypothetical protein [Candidatus Thermoplasmatota archaeon]